MWYIQLYIIYIYYPPFGGVLVHVAPLYFGTRFSDTWGYFFTQKKENDNYDKNW